MSMSPTPDSCHCGAGIESLIPYQETVNGYESSGIKCTKCGARLN